MSTLELSQNDTLGGFMLHFLTQLSLMFLISSLAMAKTSPTSFVELDLEATGTEYQRLLQTKLHTSQAEIEASKLAEIYKAGTRNLEWLVFMNSQRSDKIGFTKPGSLHGIPIETPREYNDSTILADYRVVLAQLPKVMKDILIDGQAFTKEPGLPLEAYIEFGRKIDISYQMASRWQLLEPYLSQMARLRTRDVRGFYFLNKETGLEKTLNEFSKQTADKQAQLKSWLFLTCLNNGTLETLCRFKLERAISQDKVFSFHESYLSGARANWESFFRIPAGYGFNPVRWTESEPSRMYVPFDKVQSADSATVESFLSFNLSDEFKWLGWQLVPDFTGQQGSGITVHWEPGVTPHVPGLGAHEIYMDANAPLSEWEVQWTIRHEFGHNLAFPDCYLEFYDTDRAIIVSYQLDTNDLMCSRKGRFLQRHFDDLKSTYFPSGK
jgi:hypothetical protein